MRKSATVRLTLLLSVAAACSSRECVDASGSAVADSVCEADAGVWRSSRSRTFGGYFRGGGSRSTGGSSVSPPSGASRGGFGATGAAHGSSS
jgi:hypothetical protein